MAKLAQKQIETGKKAAQHPLAGQNIKHFGNNQEQVLTTNKTAQLIHLVSDSIVSEFVILSQSRSSIVNVVVKIDINQRVANRSPFHISDVESLKKTNC